MKCDEYLTRISNAKLLVFVLKKKQPDKYKNLLLKWISEKDNSMLLRAILSMEWGKDEDDYYFVLTRLYIIYYIIILLNYY